MREQQLLIRMFTEVELGSIVVTELMELASQLTKKQRKSNFARVARMLSAFTPDKKALVAITFGSDKNGDLVIAAHYAPYLTEVPHADAS